MNYYSRPGICFSEVVLLKVAAHFNLAVSELLCKRRFGRYTLARGVAQWLLKKDGLKLLEIGKFFCCTHGSVIHNIKKIDNLIFVFEKYNIGDRNLIHFLYEC